ncbi:DUF1648 domain-containing protein [Cloacibacterium normanense]
MSNSQKIKIELTKTDKIFEILAYFLLIFYWIMVIFAFDKLPAEIPVHYNGAGEIDAFGPKNSIFMLPAIATLQFLILTALAKNPEALNFSNKTNTEQQIINATKTFRYLKIGILIVFIFIDYRTIKIAIDEKNGGLGKCFLPVFFVFIFIPVILNLYKSWKLKQNN